MTKHVNIKALPATTKWLVIAESNLDKHSLYCKCGILKFFNHVVFDLFYDPCHENFLSLGMYILLLHIAENI